MSPRALARQIAPWLLACLACCLAPAAGAQAGHSAAAVEAAYLTKIPAFVEWPAGALADSFVICVVGNDPFAELLDRAARGQSVNGRTVVVKRFATVSANPGCQVVFAAGSDAQPVPNILHVIGDTSALTVTDGANTPGGKGIINFVVVAQHIRFEIDQEAATRHDLRISSKLLSLAINARPQGSAPP